ncbi:YrhA family protein [Sphingobacterium sp. DR205]|uniref:YrhA family protein n=1 Tax=Sphingobacterium sp. DR205 TaxID=2713573 RepID=UPI0013E52061|nr:YrhA family protein [Sphingobacterium sp. DR205]QIH34540.1 hypothetical protein G6053_17295 [Sphingobacterium sp. DR205]
MSKIEKLIDEIIALKKNIGYEINKPITETQFFELKNYFESLYESGISKFYKEILYLSNGLNFNGLFLYGICDKSNLNLIEANEEWHTNKDFAEYIFYADSEQYLFVQNLQTKLFSFHPRDRFETTLFETTDDELFFQIILECALGEDIESKYL